MMRPAASAPSTMPTWPASVKPRRRFSGPAATWRTARRPPASRTRPGSRRWPSAGWGAAARAARRSHRPGAARPTDDVTGPAAAPVPRRRSNATFSARPDSAAATANAGPAPDQATSARPVPARRVGRTRASSMRPLACASWWRGTSAAAAPVRHREAHRAHRPMKPSTASSGSDTWPKATTYASASSVNAGPRPTACRRRHAVGQQPEGNRAAGTAASARG